MRKCGSRFWAHVIIDPIWTPDGELAGFAKITRDITERKQAQEALERTHQALVQTQKMEAIGQLTGGVAHDFNNLLMAVLGSLELLRKRLPDDPGLKRLVDNAMLGAQRGASLTQRMLAFARRQDIATGPVPLAELLNGMKELLGATLGSHAAVELRFDPSIPSPVDRRREPIVAGDPEPVGECARCHARWRHGSDLGERNRPSRRQRSGLGGGPLCAVGGERHRPRHGCGDSGAGDRAVLLAKGVGKGTGLGLSMVQGMTEQLGGKFVLTSKKGQGAAPRFG